ncbi:MAG: mltG [Chitinophagaceae bacterium]|nr:mltG [Chitinophagaceae bacterium]
MKRLLTVIFILIVFAALIAVWIFLAPATDFSAKTKYLYIKDGENPKEVVLRQTDTGHIVKYPSIFKWLASGTGVWNKLKPGRYEVNKGESLITIIRRLRNNHQSPVKLVITKLRTRDNFARLIGKNFAYDSATVMNFISTDDSIRRWKVDTSTFLTLLLPDNYEIYWNTSLPKLIDRLAKTSNGFWQRNNRIAKAEAQHLTPKQVYTLASIIEEETNKNDEKGNIASVYMNRLQKGMPLGADPTIKFALRDFSLRRILFGHLTVQSPYNTYRNKGLPPGPICTPSVASIDAVLNAPKTDYLYFVAKSDFSGHHQFSSNFAQHQQYAKAYQQALDQRTQQQESK